jgi:hypothetical protein
MSHEKERFIVFSEQFVATELALDKNNTQKYRIKQCCGVS